MDKFNQLVEDLNNGTLGFIHVQNAIRIHIKESKYIPDGVKGILAGTKDTDPGLICRMFSLMKAIIGNMELAYRRGEQAGEKSSNLPKDN